jgi:hypothetical protein
VLHPSIERINDTTNRYRTTTMKTKQEKAVKVLYILQFQASIV